MSTTLLEHGADPENRFSDNVQLEPQGGDRFVLRTPLTYAGITWHIVVPSGFVTDLASIPWPARLVMPRHGTPEQPYGVPAIVHDWLYANVGKIEGRNYTRKDADILFLRTCEYMGVKRARLMYCIIRYFGWWNWRGAKRKARP